MKHQLLQNCTPFLESIRSFKVQQPNVSLLPALQDSNLKHPTSTKLHALPQANLVPQQPNVLLLTILQDSNLKHPTSMKCLAELMNEGSLPDGPSKRPRSTEGMVQIEPLASTE